MPCENADDNSFSCLFANVESCNSPHQGCITTFVSRFYKFQILCIKIFEFLKFKKYFVTLQKRYIAIFVKANIREKAIYCYLSLTFESCYFMTKFKTEVVLKQYFLDQ